MEPLHGLHINPGPFGHLLLRYSRKVWQALEMLIFLQTKLVSIGELLDFVDVLVLRGIFNTLGSLGGIQSIDVGLYLGSHDVYLIFVRL